MAKPSTIIPANFVIVIPDKTLLPVRANAFAARSRFEPNEVEYALTICETNSTPIPTACGGEGRKLKRLKVNGTIKG